MYLSCFLRRDDSTQQLLFSLLLSPLLSQGLLPLLLSLSHLLYSPFLFFVSLFFLSLIPLFLFSFLSTLIFPFFSFLSFSFLSCLSLSLSFCLFTFSHFPRRQRNFTDNILTLLLLLLPDERHLMYTCI